MRLRHSIFVLAILLVATLAPAAEIEGVQPAALDQPRVYVHLRRQLKGPPLAAAANGEQSINITAFLDTGASGILLSKTTADALGVKNDKAVFHDVGVGGLDAFDVSEPLFVFIAPSGKNGEPNDADGYPMHIGPVRGQVGQAAGLMDMLTGGLDVVGMPAINGRVIVIDPKPVDTFGDTMRTGLFDRTDKRIPKTDRHVRVSYASFQRFTKLEPPTANGPTLADNPFIGPSPTGGAKDVAPIVVTYNGKSATGSFLLDTGAAASMISTKLAHKLGVTQVVGGPLIGPPEKEQFGFTVGGIGGAKKSPGFRLDSLTIPTRENDPLIYRKAPVLVMDIAVEDPQTKEKITLDGVLGMNYFVATANVDEGALLPDINQLTAGPYDWIVFNEPAAILGLKLKKEFEQEAQKPKPPQKPSIEIRTTPRKKQG